MQSALITGAGSGIGRASAEALATPGARLMLHTRANQAGLEAVAATARAKGATVFTCLGDLSEPGIAEALIGQTGEALGGLDVLVAVAGAAHRGAVMALEAEPFRKVLEESVVAFTRLAQGARALLKSSEHPRIVAVSSFVAHAFRTDMNPFAATTASRAALEALVKAMALELAPEGITVNAVVPGLIRKDEGRGSKLAPEAIARMEAMIPMGRRGTPEEVAAIIAMLASPAASYVTGQIWHVNGGLL
ncbi:MAG: dehydrogenase [Rhizobiales bacterium PAR1]|nr:MAG: dehydrogenase [Rhizobiales bacterium PAR1]